MNKNCAFAKFSFFVLLKCKTNVCKRTSVSKYQSLPENAKVLYIGSTSAYTINWLLLG